MKQIKPQLGIRLDILMMKFFKLRERINGGDDL